MVSTLRAYVESWGTSLIRFPDTNNLTWIGSFKFLRRSIFANTSIKKGTKLTRKHIITKRPLIGAGSEHFFELIGKKIKKNKKKFEPIFLNDF